jgi:hypothetical protein
MLAVALAVGDARTRHSAVADELVLTLART